MYKYFQDTSSAIIAVGPLVRNVPEGIACVVNFTLFNLATWQKQVIQHVWSLQLDILKINQPFFVCAYSQSPYNLLSKTLSD